MALLDHTLLSEFPGNWPKPGCQLNGVGSYTPLMREIDDTLVLRSEVLIDTKEAHNSQG